MKLLRIEDLTIRFGGLVAVDGMTFAVDGGEVVGLIGPNGSGKSTVFNLISGIYRPNTGTIRLKGKSLVGLSNIRIARLGVGRTFQNNRLFLQISALDNVLSGMCHRRGGRLWRSIFWTPGARQSRNRCALEAETLMRHFSAELADQCYCPASDLALADRRRLEICRALAGEPDLLLLDEPSAGMDPQETRMLMDDILKIRQQRPKIGIVIIEHDLTVIAGIAERVVVMNNGCKIAQGPYQDVVRNPEVRSAYLGGGADQCLE